MMELARADLRTLRTSTALGNIWGVLDPLFQAAIYYFLYSVLRKGQANNQFLPVLLGGFFLFQLEPAGSRRRRQLDQAVASGLLLSLDLPARDAARSPASTSR